MAEKELDLERGDPSAAARIAAEGSARSKRARSSKSDGDSGSSSGSRSGGGSKTSGKGTDASLANRLGEAFSRLADQLEARDDQELADAIRQDSRAMSQGLVSLTRAVTFLRLPLLLFLGFLEPILAFWHVGSILFGRWVARRQRVMQEREMAAAGVEVNGVPQ